jgi:hypothetical protein
MSSPLTESADYPVFGYQVPTGTATLPGKTLYITSIRIGESYAGTTSANGPMLLSYIVTVGGTSATTSTSDAATTVAPRGIVVGSQSFPNATSIGTVVPGYEVNFASPLVCPAGTFFTFVVRPSGTFTANPLFVNGSIAVNGYFE